LQICNGVKPQLPNFDLLAWRRERHADWPRAATAFLVAGCDLGAVFCVWPSTRKEKEASGLIAWLINEAISALINEETNIIPRCWRLYLSLGHRTRWHMSVCNALTFESLDLECPFMVFRYIFTIVRSGLYIKVIGSRSRSQEQNSVKCHSAIRGFCERRGAVWPQLRWRL